MGSDGTRPIEPDDSDTDAAAADAGDPPEPAEGSSGTAPGGAADGPEPAEATRVDLVALSDESLRTRVDLPEPSDPQPSDGAARTRLDPVAPPNDAAQTRVDLPQPSDDAAHAPADAGEAPADTAQTPEEPAEVSAEAAPTPGETEETSEETAAASDDIAEPPAEAADTFADAAEESRPSATDPDDMTDTPEETAATSGEATAEPEASPAEPDDAADTPGETAETFGDTAEESEASAAEPDDAVETPEETAATFGETAEESEASAAEPGDAVEITETFGGMTESEASPAEPGDTVESAETFGETVEEPAAFAAAPDGAEETAETFGDAGEASEASAEEFGDAGEGLTEDAACGDVPADAERGETSEAAEVVEPVTQAADPVDAPAVTQIDRPVEAEPTGVEHESGPAVAVPRPAEPVAGEDGVPAGATRSMTPPAEVEAEPVEAAEPVGIAAASGGAASPVGAPGAAPTPVGGTGTAVLEAAGPDVTVTAKEGKEGNAAVGAAADKAEAGAKPGRRRRKQRSRLVRYTRRIVFGVLGFIVLAIAAFAVAYMLTPVPSPQEDATAQGPEFYYDDGKTLIAKIGVNRQKVDLEAVPPHVRNAVIAAENRSFYEDPGVSVRGTIRAFWSTVSGEQLQGGSTITQQMVRNYYQGLGQERTVSRKLKEIMVSLKVGSQKDKDWILEQYLNTIYFGRDAYGIQAAAQAYYNKDVGDLTPAQAAYLAAAIQQPTPFGDPTGSHRAMAEQRWRSVVNAMTETGALSPADAAAMKFPEPNKLKVTDILKGQTGYMVRIAQKELRERRGYTEDEINRGGLKITTTFDKRLMEAAEKAVKSNLPDNVGKTTLTGLVSVDPDTGRVVAFYGGRGYLEEQLSTSFGHWAQAGSGFKPIVLAAALDDGKTLNSVVDGSSPQYYNGTPVRNSGGSSYGMINLVTATQNSVNTAYVNLGREIGLDKVTEMAEKLGIDKDQLTANGANTAPTFPLGVVSVHPVQQAGVYATFAAEGVHHTPYVVKSVTELDGDVHKYTDKGKRVFSEQVARDATYAMTKVVQSGTGTGAQLYDGRDVAGKTGTTDNGNALWFNGFIPQMATSVAIFRSDSPSKQVQIGGYSAFGGVLPAQIWRTYMTDAVDIKDLEPKSFGAPSSYTSGGGGYDRTPQQPQGPSTQRPTEPSPPPTRPNPEPTGPGSGGPEQPPEPSGPPSNPGGGGGDGGTGDGGQGIVPQQGKVYGMRLRE